MMWTTLLALGFTLPAAEPAAASRTFLFTQEAKITGLQAGATARVWLPVPPTTADQDVRVEADELPAKGRVERDAVYGNQILYIEATAGADGTVTLKRTFRVTRRERQAGPDKDLDAIQGGRLLKADANVPVGGKSLTLLKGKDVPAAPADAARLFYDAVLGHMTYSKVGTGWGRGDADWACDSGRGNCSDFHSIFIALARAHKMPAVFEIGFPLPETRGTGDIPGYHCWAFFQAKENEWTPVDISEASKNPAKRDYYFGRLTADRVLLSRGRDVELAPKAAGGSQNFFVHPYVEVDGKAWEKVDKRYGYRDLNGGADQ
ncbi:MAG: transglutaminase-like domain-containing protein [Gemmataceae bacterium]